MNLKDRSDFKTHRDYLRHLKEETGCKVPITTLEGRYRKNIKDLDKLLAEPLTPSAIGRKGRKSSAWEKASPAIRGK